jgi:hypothetical protein
MKPTPPFDRLIYSRLLLVREHQRAGNYTAAKAVIAELAALRRGRTPWEPDPAQQIKPMRVVHPLRMGR